MEESEIQHINASLPKLIHVTVCTTNFKVSLLKRNLITVEEEQRLAAFSRIDGPIREARELFGILQTRINGYEGLIEALQETGQTGALDILQEGIKGKITDGLKENAEILLQVHIQLGGTNRPLNEVFPSFSKYDALEILQNSSANKEFLRTLANKSIALDLDANLPAQRVSYVPRSLSNIRVLDSKLFRANCRDIFVFKGIEITDLVRLLEPHVTRSSTNQRSVITCRHIHLDDDEDWDDLLEIAESPIHLISRELPGYVLRRTSKITDTLLNHTLQHIKTVDAYVSEEVFVSKFLADLKCKGAVICDVSGMGKTWLVESLARKIQETGSHVSLRVELSPFSQLLQNPPNVPRKENALMLALEYACGSSLASLVLYQLTTKGTLQPCITFCMDGFDEIRKEHVEDTTKFIKELITFSNVRVIISCRSHMRNYLEKTFNIDSYDILPFARDEQVRAIVGYWRESLKENTILQHSVLEEFAQQCTDSIQNIQLRHSGEALLGVPLMCYVLAVVNEKRVHRLCSPYRRKSFEISDYAIFSSVCEMYERFIETSMEKTALHHSVKLTTELKTYVHALHMYKALVLLFPDLAKVVKCQMMHASPTIEVTRVGILIPDSVGELRFPHQSFAEYFAGKFFAEFWRNITSYDSHLVERIGLYFLQNVLGWPSGCFGGYVNGIEFNSGSSCPLPTVKRTGMFACANVIRFMNNISKEFMDSNRLLRSVQFFKQTLHSRSPTRWYMNLQCEEFLRARLYFALLECLRERLASIFSLLIQLTKTFIGRIEATELLSARNINPELIYLPSKLDKADSCIAFLLYCTALSRSIEAGDALFSLFGHHKDNWLLKFCQKYPNDLYTPLEAAAAINDLDTFLFFIDKIDVPWQRLLMSCLLSKPMTDAELTTRVLIMRHVISRKKPHFVRSRISSVPFLSNEFNTIQYNTISLPLTLDDFSSHISQLSNNVMQNLILLRAFATKHRLSLKYIPPQSKRELLTQSLMQDNDDQLIEILFFLFWECGDDIRVPKPDSTEESNASKSEIVLDGLDTGDAQKTFSGLHFLATDPVFKNIRNMKTMNVLAQIFPNFNQCNERRWNYLHYVVNTQQTEWVSQLLQKPHDVNQQDVDNNTPLHLINLKDPLKMTRVLIDHGANVYEVNKQKQNILHLLLRVCDLRNLSYVYEWVAFMLDNGRHELWNMIDINGSTPFELLSKRVRTIDKNIILTEDYVKLLFLFSLDFQVNLNTIPFRKVQDLNNLLVVVFKYKMSLDHLPLHTKQQILYRVMHDSNDSQLLVLLLLMYPKFNLSRLIPLETKTHKLNDSEILSMLNKQEMKRSLENCPLTESGLQYLYKLSTLKLMLGVCADFRECNNRKWNYLHYAVRNSRIEWVDYLIKCGHDVNESDESGFSPLAYTTLKNPLKLIKMFVDNGVDSSGVSCVYNLVLFCVKNDKDIPNDWIQHLISKGMFLKQTWCDLSCIKTYEDPLNKLARLIGKPFETSLARTEINFTVKGPGSDKNICSINKYTSSSTNPDSSLRDSNECNNDEFNASAGNNSSTGRSNNVSNKYSGSTQTNVSNNSNLEGSSTNITDVNINNIVSGSSSQTRVSNNNNFESSCTNRTNVTNNNIVSGSRKQTTVSNDNAEDGNINLANVSINNIMNGNSKNTNGDKCKRSIYPMARKLRLDPLPGSISGTGGVICRSYRRLKSLVDHIRGIGSYDLVPN